MSTMKVYGSPISTAAMRVFATLHEKDLDFEFVPINMAAGEHKSPAFLSLNVSTHTLKLINYICMLVTLNLTNFVCRLLV